MDEFRERIVEDYKPAPQHQETDRGLPSSLVDSAASEVSKAARPTSMIERCCCRSARSLHLAQPDVPTETDRPHRNIDARSLP